MAKNMLDWCLGGAAASQPPGFWLQWATGSPNDAGASDGPVPSRRTVTFGAGASPAGSVSNIAAITGWTNTAVATFLGWNIYDRSVGGTRIFYGTLTAKVGCKSADNPAFAVGALVVTLV